MESSRPLYNSYVNHLTALFGERVQKVVVDAGFTCPNRDGTKGFGGCTYCDNDAFHPSYSTPNKSITQQIEEGIEFHQGRYRRVSNYLVYFQSYTNTYASVEKLRALYSEALEHPKVVGFIVGTRPDCISKEILELLKELSQHHFVAVEYGVESVFDRTLKLINRGHDFKCAEEAIEITAAMQLPVGAHFILGLPGESKEEILSYTSYINKLSITSLKLHQLQIVKGTKMEESYKENPNIFVRWELEEYIDFIIDFLELLRPDISIERFAGEVPPRFVDEKPWGLVRNYELVRMVNRRLKERNSFQSKLYIP